MHKHTISFTDFNGNQRTKDLYFNLTEAELTKLQKDSPRGIQVEMQEAVDSGDTKVLLDFIEMLVHKSYGIKSEDGMEFEKSPELMAKFENSAYYSDLYMSLFQEEGRVGAAFISAIMPPELIKRAEANVKGEGPLAEAAERAKAFQPDARSVFDQRQAERNETIQVQEAPQSVTPPQPLHNTGIPLSQQYSPTNQPAYPSVSPEELADFEAFKAARAAESHISRPPHESGPGFEASDQPAE